MLSQAQHIENLNYYSDSRTQGPKEAPTLEVYNDDGECIEIIPLPTHYEVCTGCHGTGTYVNPSIDCGGLSEENHSDPEFMDELSTGSIGLDATNGDGWFTWEEPTQMGLPTASNLKLIGQFTTLGQGGICGQLNLEVRTLIDGQGEQFEQAFGLTFASPGSEDLCATANPCPEGTDVDEDGMVTIADLLLVLGQFGGVTEGPADIDGDGTVTIADERDSEQVAVVVSDDGPGIPEEVRARIQQRRHVVSAAVQIRRIVTQRRRPESARVWRQHFAGEQRR